MTALVTLGAIKADLRLEPDVTDEDAHLERLLAAAIRSVERRTRKTITGAAPTMSAEDMPMANQAVSLIVATWYALPEGVSVDGRAGSGELPLGVTWLLDPITSWAVD